tara:strand:+ start:196 stop:1302 length:1107 start_codon:yes stop_codon:yes gene_type:complete
MMGLAWSVFGSPALRLVDSETAHTISMRVMKGIGETNAGQNLLNAFYGAPEVPIEVFGKIFHHPLGLAAGFDKGAEALMAWSAMGFSWTEYGGVTRYPQDGNPKPRMFRANKHKALVNKMGFNNPGASEIRNRLIKRKSSDKWPNTPVAANIGRSKKVPNDHAADDYASTMDILWDHADMFVLNISSPNTPGLRELQDQDYLSSILSSCNKVRQLKEEHKPVLVKLSPDNSDDEILDTVSLCARSSVDGIVATNTTIRRPAPLSTQSRKAFSSDGGLSGRPLKSRSLEVINLVYGETQGKIPIVGVGGIESKETAWEAIISGSSLIQLYSALVFNGPTVVSSIVRGIKRRVKESEFSSLSEAVGYKHI